MDKAWNTIDAGLRDLMDNNDQLSDGELRAKTRRLEHLERFVKTLRARVNERIKGQAVGDIEPLFTKYAKERNLVDEN